MASYFRPHSRGGSHGPLRKHHSYEALTAVQKASSDSSDADGESSHHGGAPLESFPPLSHSHRDCPKRPASQNGECARPKGWSFNQVPYDEHGNPVEEQPPEGFDMDELAAHTTPLPNALVGERPEAIQANDPQVLYPRTACVFVANLPSDHSDEELISELTKLFSSFGLVFVKIKRDGRTMPFAFLQYTNDESALKAINQGNGLHVFSRPCRVELSKSNAIFLVSKKSGGTIEIHEAYIFMVQYGHIQSISVLEDHLCEMLKLRDAVVVYFRTYDPTRDVVAVTRDDEVWDVQKYDPAKPEGTPLKTPRNDLRLQIQMSQYDRDRRSVYIGNLHPTHTERDLLNIARQCGHIVELQLHVKHIRSGLPYARFAFVEFADPLQTQRCIRQFNGAYWSGKQLLVEQKVSRVFRDTPPNSTTLSPTLYRSRPGFNANQSPTRPHGPSHARAVPQYGVLHPPRFRPQGSQALRNPLSSPLAIHGDGRHGHPIMTPSSSESGHAGRREDHRYTFRSAGFHDHEGFVDFHQFGASPEGRTLLGTGGPVPPPLMSARVRAMHPRAPTFPEYRPAAVNRRASRRALSSSSASGLDESSESESSHIIIPEFHGQSSSSGSHGQRSIQSGLYDGYRLVDRRSQGAHRHQQDPVLPPAHRQIGMQGLGRYPEFQVTTQTETQNSQGTTESSLASSRTT